MSESNQKDVNHHVQQSLLDADFVEIVQSAREKILEAVQTELAKAYAHAERIVETGDDILASSLVDGVVAKVDEIASTKHAARGALLTLALYKAAFPTQDIRRVKAEHEGGFSARTIDSAITVPFLMKHSLPRSVETHWLTQTFSIAAAPWERTIVLKTSPSKAGLLLIDVANVIEEAEGTDEQRRVARLVAVLILTRLIRVRNRSQVPITRPKNLTIDATVGLLEAHFARKYKAGAPRLPQLAIYAAYECLVRDGTGRFKDAALEQLGRMKAADRKSGTVGDIVVSRQGLPIEAVETKLGVQIGLSVVGEAMEKVKSAAVHRYYILSTAGYIPGEQKIVSDRIEAFRKSNGCEIIVDGVLETVSYSLRVISSTTAFIDSYAELLGKDQDLDYEHRIAWNELCAALGD